MSDVLLLTWDMTGIEAVVNLTEIDKQRVWNTLTDNTSSSMSLNTIVNSMILRARANPQRHYEIYTVTVSEGITEEDVREMFETNPQYAADLIRERGNKVYSDRISKPTQRIV